MTFSLSAVDRERDRRAMPVVRVISAGQVRRDGRETRQARLLRAPTAPPASRAAPSAVLAFACQDSMLTLMAITNCLRNVGLGPAT